jgi:hypothetical protein
LDSRLAWMEPCLVLLCDSFVTRQASVGYSGIFWRRGRTVMPLRCPGQVGASGSDIQYRHCEERSDEAIQSQAYGSGLLPPTRKSASADAVASLAMTEERHRYASSRRIAPELCIVHRPRKAEGAGKAGWPHAPGLSRKRNLRERENHRYRRRHSGLPRAVVYGLYVLSLVSQCLFATIASQHAFGACTRLDASVGASGPHDFAVRKSAVRLSAPSRPPHSASRFVTTRTPLVLEAERAK